MRKLAVLLLAVPALAQDDGTALFYKGFWLEQAEGKLDEAAALYAQLLKEKPDAVEAPRALLGLVRIKVARNEDAKELVVELERRYPAAKEEIAGARRIVGERANSFAEPVRETDSGVERKIKYLYQGGLSKASDADRSFLVDLGSVAHPMLAALLRGTEQPTVLQAAWVLLSQRTREAQAVLARALLDDSTVFRGEIVSALKNGSGAPLILVEALEKLYETAPPRLRTEVVGRLASMAGFGGDGRDRAYAVLVRALDDGDDSVRASAIVLSGAPDAYVDALLRRLEAKDPAMWTVYDHLPRLADRAVFRPRIDAIFDAYAIRWNLTLPDPSNEEGALLLARRIERELKGGNRHNGVYNVAYMCSGRSARAAADLILAAMEIDDWKLLSHVRRGMGEHEQVQYLGDHAAPLRAAALEMSPAPGEPDRRAVTDVIAMLDLGSDFPAITDALRRRGGRGLPAVLLDGPRLEALGPANAGALVAYCRDGKDVERLLAAGRRFAEREDSGVEFFRQVVPRAGPECAGTLRKLAENPMIAPIIAEQLLEASGREWGWTTEGQRPMEVNAERQPGPYVWNRLWQRGVFTTPAFRLAVAPRTDDPRLEVASAAAWAAAAAKTEAGTEALRKVLESRWSEARGTALVALATRADAPAIVREFAARKDLAPEDRQSVSTAISVAKNPAITAIAGELLREGPEWGLLWGPYSTLAPKEAVELALNAIPPTVESLGVLVQADDPRRIAIFRAVLNGTDRDAIRVVLRAVNAQYLVELGEETLAQLRSPDKDTRDIATAAIDRLKFYAEAKKAFEK